MPRVDSLKATKTLHENQLQDLKNNLSSLVGRIEESVSKLTALKAQSAQGAAEAKEALSAQINALNEQKKALEEHIFNQNKELVNLNSEILEAEREAYTHRQHQNIFNKKKEEVKKAEIKSTSTSIENVSSNITGLEKGNTATGNISKTKISQTPNPITRTSTTIPKGIKISIPKIMMRAKSTNPTTPSAQPVTYVEPTTTSAPEGSEVTFTGSQNTSSGSTQSPRTYTDSSPKNTLEAPIQTLKATKSAAGAASNIKGLVSTVKNLRMVAAAGTGPVGIALALAPFLAKFGNQIKKAIAAGVALALYLAYLFYLKILGLLSGLAFGLVTGLPLLAIPVVGPVLYAGWVGFWTFKGFTDPLATIHLATHPWEAITKPFNWLKDTFSGAGGGAESVTISIASTATGALGTVGSWTMAAWNTTISTAGNAIGWVASGFDSGIHLIGNIGSSVPGLAAKAVGLATGTTVTVALAGQMFTNSAFSSPDGDVSGPQFPAGQNELFTLTKTVDKAALLQPGGLIHYKITLTPKTQNLTQANLVDNLRDVDANNNQTPLAHPPTTCTTPITTSSPCVIEFDTDTGPLADNSTVINTIFADVTAQDGTKKSDSITVTTKIGSPPARCPSGWPTRTGTVTQGPMGRTSHGDPPVDFGTGGLEAIDIGVVHEDVFSTVDGVVFDIYPGSGAEDLRVDVTPNGCSNLDVVSYWHLISTNVTEGQSVTAGSTQIGVSGLEGTGYHTHYQFGRSFDRDPQITDYLPKPVPRTCDGDCGVTIP